MSIKFFLLRGGGYFEFWGGGSADFIFSRDYMSSTVGRKRGTLQCPNARRAGPSLDKMALQLAAQHLQFQSGPLPCFSQTEDRRFREPPDAGSQHPSPNVKLRIASDFGSQTQIAALFAVLLYPNV